MEEKNPRVTCQAQSKHPHVLVATMTNMTRTMMMIRCRNPAQSWRGATHDLNCRPGNAASASPEQQRLSLLLQGCLKIGRVFKGKKICCHIPPVPSLHGSAVHLQLHLQGIWGGAHFQQPFLPSFPRFVPSVTCQCVTSLHLSL